jgi:hypothetical protein
MAQPPQSSGEDPALTYFGLRAAIGAIGIALPVVLLLTGIADGHVQPSISSYYYTHMRDYFTGTMCVIGVFLFSYRFGTWRSEGLLTKIAGIAALGVAFFHTAPSGPASIAVLRLSNVHLACAGVLFAILGVISFVFFPSAESTQERRAGEVWVYRGLGLAIWVSIVLMVALNWLIQDFFERHHLLFWLETVAVVAFSVSFLIKGEFVPRTLRVASTLRRRHATRILNTP